MHVLDAGSDFWTSASRFIDAFTWIWFSTGKQIDYSHWQAGHPVGGQNHCLYLRHNRNQGLFWLAGNCFSRMKFVCEKLQN